MNTNHVTELLNDYLDGELSSDQSNIVEDHLRNCPSCQSELNSLRTLVEDLHELPKGIDPPAEFFEELQSKFPGRSSSSAELDSRHNGSTMGSFGQPIPVKTHWRSSAGWY